MSQDRIRLLQHIIYQSFGPAVGEVATILLARGALSFAHLTRLSSLPPSKIHQSLLVLSIHTLLYHSESEVNDKITELYEINQDHVEERMRGALYITMANGIAKDHHSVLGKIVQLLWENGMTTAKDLMKETIHFVKMRHDIKLVEQGAITNALADGSSSSSKGKGKAKALKHLTEKQAESKAKSILTRAFDDGYIAIVTPESQLIPSSLEIQWEAQAKEGMKAVPSAKEIKELKDTIEKRKQSFFQEQKAQSMGMTSEELDESYRKKRVRSPYDEDDMYEDATKHRDLPSDAAFRINAERFHMIWRSEMMKDFAADIYNPQIGCVFGVVLRIADQSTHSLDQNESRSINLTEIWRTWRTLDASEKLDPRHSFSEEAAHDPKWGRLSDKKEDQLVEQILFILAKNDDLGMNATASFLRQVSEGTSAKWHVRYAALGSRMKRALVEAMIAQKLDKNAVKCWRILDAKGKLDEKHLARLAFLTVKDARETLARLSALGMIESQEVPRSADRAPSRTFFLWYVDYPKVVRNLLDHQYKALANLQVQRAHQLEQRKQVVEKSQRRDVREDRSLLSTRDRELLAELDKLLEALTVAQMRIDKQVFILKDLDS